MKRQSRPSRSRRLLPTIGFASLILGLTMSACSGTSEGEVGTETSADPGPAEVAVLYVDAFRGRPEALLRYDPDAKITKEVNLPAVFNEGFLQNAASLPPEVEMSTLNDTAIEALKKAEVTVTSEEIAGDQGTVLVDIRGLDFEAAVENAEQRVSINQFDTEEEFFSALLLESWEVAALGSDSSELEMILIRSQDADTSGKWMLTVADTSSTEIYEIFEALMYS